MKIDPVTMSLYIDPIIRQALREDISNGDLTTNAIIGGDEKARVKLISKEEGILAGIDVFCRVFSLLDKDIRIHSYKIDGDLLKSKDIVAELEGDVAILLSAERVALNFLQRMSGIATYTAGMVKLLEGTTIKLLDTRKTTPNMRILEKYAVRVGGGKNHRYNLSDGILLKDNHIAAAGGVKMAIQKAKAYAPAVDKIEIEVESLDMVDEALEAGADIIMLDNMSPEIMRQAVERINHKAEVECSGNVTRESIKKYSHIGVDYISSGALTHSAPILDLSMKELSLL